MKRPLISLITCLALMLPWMSMAAHAAGTALLYIEPDTGQVNQGDNFTVTVFEDSDLESVNAVQANFNYSTANLQFVSIGNTAAFEIVAQNSGGGGSVQIARGTTTAKSGPQSVATITFKALTGGVSTSLTSGSGSAIVRSSDNANILGQQTGGTYTLVSTSTGGGGTGGGGTGGGGTGGGGTTTTPKKTTPKTTAPKSTTTTPAATPKDTTAPKISNIKVSNVDYYSVQINWTTDEASSSEVDYGLSNKYGFSSINNTLTTNHTVVLNSALIYPGLSYHFMVKSLDKSSNQAVSDDNTFHTKGAALVATVLNKKNSKPVSGAEVSFGDSSAVTDKQGHASVDGLAIGKNIGVISYKGHQSAATVTVDKNDIAGPSKTATYKIDVPESFPWLWVIPPVIILVLIAWWIGMEEGGGKNPFKGWRSGGSGPDLPPGPTISSDMSQTPQPPPTVIHPGDS